MQWFCPWAPNQEIVSAEDGKHCQGSSVRVSIKLESSPGYLGNNLTCI